MSVFLGNACHTAESYCFLVLSKGKVPKIEETLYLSGTYEQLLIKNYMLQRQCTPQLKRARNTIALIECRRDANYELASIIFHI